ncbi:plasma membrane ascorbate-dependent reductase CYBRD1 isoform X2 [Coccinella septempunctata]|uniref:plasma membrane ascorbate-dependent reductase CYBRD1 isoform X2 n=1 Tax=Coccinella septempunctata TaxID=41139 RepID=UPI001D0669A2|nr:plasma membrane ascorbate-dependent reductase CYBRD1 isoform X2 [Coccinella septempunctata]
MESNSVSPMPTEMAPIAEFEKTTPTPMEDAVPMDDLPPPPTAVSIAEEKEKEAAAEAEGHRHYEDENEWGCGNWLEYTLVIVLATILLLGSLGLTLFWVINYHGGFAWQENPRKQFNLHPVLMVAGFITFSGFSILLYRICRCCRRIYVKLLHTVFHALAIPCVALGFLAVLDSHNLADPPIPNFYSLHSWIGLVTMGLFAIQFVIGFFSFLILLCCEGATAGFRSAMVPIHASFGLTTFMLAIAACVTGLTEKVMFKLGDDYSQWKEEGIVVNVLGAILIALGILVSFAVRSPTLKGDTRLSVTERL